MDSGTLRVALVNGLCRGHDIEAYQRRLYAPGSLLQNKSVPPARLTFHVKAHSGFFHLLPLGSRVQEKLERLIDKHMSILGIPLPFCHASAVLSLHLRLGASKVSLSSFSAPDLWRKSGRYKDDNPEVRFTNAR